MNNYTGFCLLVCAFVWFVCPFSVWSKRWLAAVGILFAASAASIAVYGLSWDFPIAGVLAIHAAFCCAVATIAWAFYPERLIGLLISSTVVCVVVAAPFAYDPVALESHDPVETFQTVLEISPVISIANECGVDLIRMPVFYKISRMADYVSSTHRRYRNWTFWGTLAILFFAVTRGLPFVVRKYIAK